MSAEKLETIKKRIEFAKENPTVPFLFKVNSGYSGDLTDAKDKQSATGTYFYPAITTVNFDSGDGKGLKKNIIIYNGDDDVRESVEFYKNAQGKFEEPALPLIQFEQYQLAVYGDSLKGLKLLEYLSLCEQFGGGIKCQDLTQAPKVGTMKPGALTVEEIVNYSQLIDQLAKTEDGFDLIKSLAKNTKLNPNYAVVDGLAKMKNGKAEIVSIVKQYLTDTDKTRLFTDVFLPKKENKNLLEELIKGDLLGYNAAGKAFQFRKGKDFEKEVLFITESENETVRLFLFAHNLGKENDKKVKLQNILKELAV